MRVDRPDSPDSAERPGSPKATVHLAADACAAGPQQVANDTLPRVDEKPHSDEFELPAELAALGARLESEADWLAALYPARAAGTVTASCGTLTANADKRASLWAVTSGGGSHMFRWGAYAASVTVLAFSLAWIRSQDAASDIPQPVVEGIPLDRQPSLNLMVPAGLPTGNSAFDAVPTLLRAPQTEVEPWRPSSKGLWFQQLDPTEREAVIDLLEQELLEVESVSL